MAEQHFQDNQYDVITSPRADVVNAFMRGVYLWMSIGLIITAACAWGTVKTPALMQIIFNNSFVYIGLLIAEIALVVAISAMINKLSAATATGLFMLFSAINGVTLSCVVVVYTYQSVASAFLTAAGMFGAMSVYGLVTKRDLTSLGSFMFMGLIGIIIAMIVNWFIGSSLLALGINILGVFIFLGLTAYDTQKWRNMGEAAPYEDATAVRRGTILGALDLYLDFINIFLFLLRLMGDRR